MERHAVLGLLLVLSTSSCAGSQTAAIAPSGVAGPPLPGSPSVTLNEWMPSDGATLTKGTTARMSAAVTLNASTTEPVKFTGTIEINGRERPRNGPFVTVLTPLVPGVEEHMSEDMSWFVAVDGPKDMTVRLRLDAWGITSHAHVTLADVTRTYHVKCNDKTFVLFRMIQRMTGRCR